MESNVMLAPLLLLLLLPVVSLAIGVMMIIGALRMMRLRSYGWSMTASILALLPFSPVSLLAIPMGIWSLIVLNRRNVKAAFVAKPARKPAATPLEPRYQHAGEVKTDVETLANEPQHGFQQADESKSSVEQISSHPQAEVSLPDERPGSDQSVGISTIFEREAVNLRNWFVPEPAKTAKQHPRLPAALMIVLSIAGCLMVLLPWMDLEIDYKTAVGDRTLAGSDRWPGITAAVAFGCLALLILVTPTKRRLPLKETVLMTAIAAFALLHTFLFKMDLEWGSFPVPISTESFSSDSGPPSLSSIDHRITYREGFYGSLGLSLVLLVLSATGVRNATVWRAENKQEPKQPADPDKRADTAAPLATVRFSIPKDPEIGPQVVFHFTEIGYSLVEERLGEWIFRRGKKWSALWDTDIRRLHTKLTVRTMPQPQGGLWVSCKWVTKTYGAFVFRRDIKKLEAEGRELETLLRGESAPPLPNLNTLLEAPPAADSATNDVDGIASEPRGVPQQTHPQQLHPQTIRDFTTTPQPSFGKRVLMFVLAVLGVVMVASLAALLLTERTFKLDPGKLDPGVTLMPMIPLAFLLLAVLWAVRRGRSRSLGQAERAHRPRPPRRLLLMPVLFGLAALTSFVVCAGVLVYYWRFTATRMESGGGEASVTIPSRSVATQKTTESTNDDSRNWILGPQGPMLSDIFAQAWLRPSQIKPVNKALQKSYREYLALEAQHTQQSTTEEGHLLTIVKPPSKDLEAIEGRLWSQLDSILDVKQQNLFRNNLELKSLSQSQRAHVGKPMSELVKPGVFGWGKLGANIEIWREGTWFRWKLKTGTYELSSRAPELPAVYRRYWKEDRPSDESSEAK